MTYMLEPLWSKSRNFQRRDFSRPYICDTDYVIVGIGDVHLAVGPADSAWFGELCL